MQINLTYKGGFDLQVKFRINASVDWLCGVLASDEFKWKARKFPERDLFLEKVNGFTFNVKKLFPEGGTNAKYPALYDKDTSTLLPNKQRILYMNKEELGAVIGHEFTHEFMDHDEYDINSFPYFIQSEVKNMEGKSNLYYKTLIWLYEHPVIKWSLIGIAIVAIILMTLTWK